MARFFTKCSGVVVLLAAGTVPYGAGAQTLQAAGDGAGTNNPDLISDGTLAPPPVTVTEERLLAGPPREERNPFFEADWSISLRGSYQHGSEGSRFVAGLVPAFALSHAGRRSTISFDASSTLTADDGGAQRIESLEAGGEVTYALDRDTEAFVSARAGVSHDDPANPGMADDIVETPYEIDGTVTAGIGRRFGRLGLEVTGDLARHHETDTILTGGGIRPGRPASYWRGGGTLRAGFELTPILTPFVEAEADYTGFDAAPVSTGVKRDGWDYVISGGLAAQWRDVITAEASIGYGVRTFDAGSIDDVRALVYGLDLSYAPNTALMLGASLSSRFEAGDPDAGEQAATVYEVTADAALDVNRLVTLRGALSGNMSRPRDGGLSGYGYGVGAGADFSLNRQTSLTFDYTYDVSHEPPDETEHAHGVTLGLTFSR